MAKSKKAASKETPRDMHKLSLEYNLETDPLSTGERTSRVSLRERAAMGFDKVAVDKWSAGWMVLLLVVLIVAAGGYGIWFVIRLFESMYASP